MTRGIGIDRPVPGHETCEPCVTAAADPPETGVVVAHDLGSRDDADRWPRFAPYAASVGYRSILSTQLAVRPGGTRTALNLYAVHPHTFGESAVATAGTFAAQAAMLLFGADEAQHLKHAVDTRDVIGQAKGILMERFTLDGAQAFQMLVSSSQDINIKLVDVAQWLVSEAERRTPAASTS